MNPRALLQQYFFLLGFTPPLSWGRTCSAGTRWPLWEPWPTTEKEETEFSLNLKSLERVEIIVLFEMERWKLFFFVSFVKKNPYFCWCKKVCPHLSRAKTEKTATIYLSSSLTAPCQFTPGSAMPSQVFKCVKLEKEFLCFYWSRIFTCNKFRSRLFSCRLRLQLLLVKVGYGSTFSQTRLSLRGGRGVNKFYCNQLPVFWSWSRLEPVLFGRSRFEDLAPA